MSATQPVRLLSVVIVAVVVVVGIRGILNGLSFDGDPLDRHHGGAPRDATAVDAHRTRGTVAYVLDGDTIQVTTRSGRSVRVRFLGISAPEIPHPGKAGECYGYPATRHLKQLLPVGTHVVLMSDPTQENADVYGRVLRYVEAGGRDVGAAQISAGSAAARDSARPVLRHLRYARLENRARGQRLGMWSACS
ncbi:thermonuclease family protein [Nocardioides sp. KR10-350]|uniref:thermonuclease family protein n=1 Tax=Nocardioides cheoyonin TaxID=3156615 RepID=UPI0032B61D13